MAKQGRGAPKKATSVNQGGMKKVPSHKGMGQKIGK